MTTTGLTDADRERIRELHSQGASCSAVARDLGVARSTVSRHAATMGLAWDSAQTAQATHAKQVSNRERRAATIVRLYDQADRVLDRLDAPVFKLVGMDKDGYARTNHIDQDAVPAADVRALHASAVNLLNSAARLESVDAGHTDTEHARGILGALGDSLQAAYGSLAAGRAAPAPPEVDDAGEDDRD